MRKSIAPGAGIQFSFPGKTFLVGEYLALAGGPSIILTTAPRFELIAQRKNQPDVQDSSTLATAKSEAFWRDPFAPQSPAGRLLQKHGEFFRGFDLEFRDPHKGLGGLGASTAQFAGVWALLNDCDNVQTENFDYRRLLSDYRVCAWSGEGEPPSGADLAAQMTGGVTWFDGESNRARRLNWNFRDLGFTLIRTGKKLATHEHLKTAKGSVPHERLRAGVTKATNAFETNDAGQLVDAVTSVGQSLADAGFTAQATLELLGRLRSETQGVLAAKGCGAMGADVIVCLHSHRDGLRIREWVKNAGLVTCGSDADLSSGLSMVRNSQ
jgi:mevalonate kinase